MTDFQGGFDWYGPTEPGSPVVGGIVKLGVFSMIEMVRTRSSALGFGALQEQKTGRPAPLLPARNR